jgi:hypothetical protein
MRKRRSEADIVDMESGRGRFRRADEAEETRRGLRAEILALRRELELLDEVLQAGPTPISARAALDRSFFALRAAERAWRDSRLPSDLLAVVNQLGVAREALGAALEALARSRARAGPASG